MNPFEIRSSAEEVEIKVLVKRLNALVADSAKGQVKTEIPQGIQNIVIDLTEVEFADSVGLSVLLAIQRQLPPGSPKVRLKNVQPQLITVLKLANMAAYYDFI
jgi:anti-anti-sigma factor